LRAQIVQMLRKIKKIGTMDKRGIFAEGRWKK
jgi:hypothetical protein